MPENEALIRFALMAPPTYEQVDKEIDLIEERGEEYIAKLLLYLRHLKPFDYGSKKISVRHCFQWWWS